VNEDERQRMMDFILEQQAQFAVNIQQLSESQASTAETVSRLSTQVERLTAQVGQVVRQQEHINEVMAVIANVQ
jgi:hypothetical protein